MNFYFWTVLAYFFTSVKMSAMEVNKNVVLIQGNIFKDIPGSSCQDTFRNVDLTYPPASQAIRKKEKICIPRTWGQSISLSVCLFVC